MKKYIKLVLEYKTPQNLIKNIFSPHYAFNISSYIFTHLKCIKIIKTVTVHTAFHASYFDKMF